MNTLSWSISFVTLVKSLSDLAGVDRMFPCMPNAKNNNNKIERINLTDC